MAYGHLFDSFWTSRMNHRGDEYGGSLDNRMRFSREVLDEVRRQVGHDYVVGVRMAMDENLEGGLGKDEGLEIATPDRMIGQEVGGTNIPAYLKAFYENGVAMSLNRRLVGVERSGGRLKAHLYNEFDDSRQERLVDQVVVEHGTLPADDLYFELKEMSANRGEIDMSALIQGRLESPNVNDSGRFDLFRVGDAVASRNIHAAILDSLRICKDL